MVLRGSGKVGSVVVVLRMFRLKGTNVRMEKRRGVKK